MAENTRRKGSGSFLIALGAALMLFVIILFIAFPPGDDDDDGNGTVEAGPWTDLSELKSAVSEVDSLQYREADGPEDLDRILNPEDTVYMLIGMEKNLTSLDLVSIRDFLLKGGKVIVADDGKLANNLTSYIASYSGADVEFTGLRYLVDKRLTDPEGADRGYLYNMFFIKARINSIIAGPMEVIAHEANGLEVTGSYTPLANTKMNLTVIDVNSDSQMDLGDKYRPYGPIGVELSVGDNGGKVQFFSTTGIFTDNVMALAENELFVKEDILRLLPQGGSVLLDPSKQMNERSPHEERIQV